MKNDRGIDDGKEAFWLVVVDCLSQFHHWKRPKAKSSVVKLRKRLESELSKSDISIIYHEEPFALACDIAEKQIEIATHSSEYEKLLEKRGW